MADLFASIFRDWSIDGDSSSPAHKPDKAKIREWGAVVEQVCFQHFISRDNSSVEGGQLAWGRASDNAVAWYTDVAGSGTNPAFRVFNDGAVGVQLTYGATSWSALSDETMKTDLVPIDGAVAKIGTLRALTGRYVTDEPDVSRAFLIAQDVQKVLPQAVQCTPEGLLTLCYDDLVPLLVAAVKELSARVASLENQH